jgi:hypothetical protein
MGHRGWRRIVAEAARHVLSQPAEGRNPIARYLPRAYMATAAVPTPIEADEDKLTVTARFELTESN